MLHCLVFCLSLCRTVLRTRTAQERLRQDYRYYILHNSQHKTRLAKSEEARRSVRTEHAAQASQTRVRFLLRQDEAIHPRYAPQGQHGSDSYFFISHCFFFSQLRFQLRTSHRQLLPKNSLLAPLLSPVKQSQHPQAPVALSSPFSSTS